MADTTCAIVVMMTTPLHNRVHLVFFSASDLIMMPPFLFLFSQSACTCMAISFNYVFQKRWPTHVDSDFEVALVLLHAAMAPG